MSWDAVLNHDAAAERFRRSLQRNRLASTYLFVGQSGIGKRLFAFKLAEALLCEQNEAAALLPCGNCSSCQQVQSQSHPDLILVSKPADKAFIPLEAFIGDKEHRRQEGLCHDIGLKPFRGGRKIAIIDDADFLNQEGANSLLKTLEEPPPHSLLILIGTSQQRQLSTIVSRSQVVRFHALDNQQVLQVLQGLLAEQPPTRLDESTAERVDLLRELIETKGDHILETLARSSSGSIERALKLADPAILQFREQLFAKLASRDPAAGSFIPSVIAFLDGDGKESAKKRARLIMVGDFAIEFYRHWMVRVSDMSQGVEQADPGLDQAVCRAIEPFQEQVLMGVEIAGRCIERTTQMQQQVVANAGAPNVIETWLRDLGRLSRRDFAVFDANG